MPAHGRVWNKMSFKIPSSPNHPVTPWLLRGALRSSPQCRASPAQLHSKFCMDGFHCVTPAGSLKVCPSSGSGQSPAPKPRIFMNALQQGLGVAVSRAALLPCPPQQWSWSHPRWNSGPNTHLNTTRDTHTQPKLAELARGAFACMAWSQRGLVSLF